MNNYYEILGLNSSATPDEIRRAYRILARRYHPDVNPGKGSADKFRLVAEAYENLIDQNKRRLFDIELGNQNLRSSRLRGYKTSAQKTARERYFEAHFENLQRSMQREEQLRQAQTGKAARTNKPEIKTKSAAGFKESVTSALHGFASAWREFSRERSRRDAENLNEKRKAAAPPRARLSIVEVSISTRDAILGVRKTVEFNEPEGLRKISVRIPAGARSGSVIRMRQKEQSAEELILIIKVAPHPFLSLQPKGVVAEIPITIAEAINGANLTLPTLDGTTDLSLPPGTQSGHEVRLKEAGVQNADGTRGDLFFRFIVKVPACYNAVGIDEKAKELDRYFEAPVRGALPATLLD